MSGLPRLRGRALGAIGDEGNRVREARPVDFDLSPTRRVRKCDPNLRRENGVLFPTTSILYCS